jgi:hypothetical protein
MTEIRRSELNAQLFNKTNAQIFKARAGLSDGERLATKQPKAAE